MQPRRKLLHSVLANFRLCHNLSTLEHVKQLVHFLASEGFYPSDTKGGEPVHKARDINALLDERYTVLNADDKGLGGLLRNLGFVLIPPQASPSEIWCACEWAVFKGERVKFGIVGGVWAYPEEQKIYQEPFAQSILDLVQKLYHMIQPEYVSIIDPATDSEPMNHTHVSKYKITTLSWVNIFGSGYMAKYGKSLFANIPGYSKQDLPDGGIMYQSRSNIFVEDNKAYKQWQNDAIGYFAENGIKIHFHKL